MQQLVNHHRTIVDALHQDGLVAGGDAGVDQALHRGARGGRRALTRDQEQDAIGVAVREAGQRGVAIFGDGIFAFEIGDLHFFQTRHSL